MAHGGGGQQPSCTTVSFGKAFRRAFRAATGIKKKPKKVPAAANSVNVPVPTMERVSSFSSESASGTSKESVVRVVLRSGVVEAYPGVVLACTVIQNHPPGLCLAHPDVFRNPHGAVVRPLEPLLPGQKFLLLPESTVIHLKQKIPESSIGAFFSDDDEKAEEEQSDRDYSSGTTTASSSEEEVDEERDKAVGDEDGGFMAGCCARDFYEEKDRWSRCQFKKLVKRDLAVERATDDQPERNSDSKLVKKKKGQNKKKKRKGKTKKRKERRVTAPPGFRNLMVPRRMWEPSLPSVLEEEETCASSQQHTPSQATTPEITRSK